MKLNFKGTLEEFKSMICHALGCEKPKIRFWTIKIGPDEPIPKEKMKLTKPIKPGFRRPFTITPDEPVDAQSDGSFYSVEVLSGDSTVKYDPSSTSMALKGWFNGDGALGSKSVRIKADGHIGDGEVEITLDVDYDVATPDATSLTLVEGVDEPIP